MIFEELTERTRAFMLEEFQAEQASGSAYRPRVLTSAGEAAFIPAMEEHLLGGNELSLTAALSTPTFWVERGTRNTKKGPVSFFLPAAVRARTFAITDFNTWYVRGLCRVLMQEGELECEIYRAEAAYEPRGECLTFEGNTFMVEEVYRGHRARYASEGSSPSAFSIPIGPNCHHTIRRKRNKV